MSSADFSRRIVIGTTKSERSWKLDKFANVLYKKYNKNNYQVNVSIWKQVSSENEKNMISDYKDYLTKEGSTPI